jgi:hypothetical protein
MKFGDSLPIQKLDSNMYANMSNVMCVCTLLLLVVKFFYFYILYFKSNFCAHNLLNKNIKFTPKVINKYLF